MLRYCPKCDTERELNLVQRPETYPVKGEPITVLANVMVCPVCGTDVFDEDLDSQNLAAAYAQYRQQKGLLGPQDIKGIREKYGLSQRGLAALLGWSQATVVRYEAGAIPSVAHNEQLRRFAEDSTYAENLFREARERLGRLERARMEKVLSSSEAVRDPEVRLRKYIQWVYSRYPMRYKGGREFDLDKLVNMALFFAIHCKDIVKSKLLKLLWYSDFLSFKRHSCSISGTVYCHNHHGPVPFKHHDVLAYMLVSGLIAYKPYDGPYRGDCIEPLAEFDDSLFNKEELQVLYDVLSRFGHFTAKDLSRVTHQEDGYANTDHMAPVPYHYAVTLKAIE